MKKIFEFFYKEGEKRAIEKACKLFREYIEHQPITSRGGTAIEWISDMTSKENTFRDKLKKILENDNNN